MISILSSHPDNWDDFFKLLETAEVPDDFLNPTERTKLSGKKTTHDPFEWLV